LTISQPFKLDLSGINYQPVTRDLLIQYLRTRQQDTLSALNAQHREQRLEDYIVRALVDFDDISYDDHAELLYDLAGQVTRHLQGYLSEDDTRNVLQYHERQIAEFIHVQMQPHYWEKAAGYEVVVYKGIHDPETLRVHGRRCGQGPGRASGRRRQGQDRPARLWRVQPVSLSFPKISVRR